MTMRLAGAPPPVVGVSPGAGDGATGELDGASGELDGAGDVDALGTGETPGVAEGESHGDEAGVDAAADGAGGESVPRIGSPPISEAAGVARLSPNPAGGAYAKSPAVNSATLIAISSADVRRSNTCLRTDIGPDRC